MKYYSLTIASAYGSCNYGTSQFDNAANCTTTTTAAGGNTDTGTSAGGVDGLLANTGVGIVLIVTLACAVMFAALLVRFARRPAKETASTTSVDE
jgi:Na+/proline symporter